MNRISAIVVGGGRMGRRYAQLLAAHPAARVAAIVGNSEAGLEEARKAFPDLPALAGGLTEDLFARFPEANAVVVSTPEWAHEAPALLALAAGKHLLLEKPIADSLPAAQRITDSAAASGALAMPCHTVRFDARAVAVRNQMLELRAIGPVRRIYARRNADRQAYTRLCGRTDPSFWLLPHDFDLLTFLTGERVIELRGRAIGGPEPGIGGVVCEARLEGGADVTLETTWITPPLSLRARVAFIDLFGDAGAIELDLYHGGVTAFADAHAAEAVDPYYAPQTAAFTAGADGALIDHFVRAALGLCEPLCRLEDGLRAVEAAAAVSRSIESGHPEVLNG